MSGIFISYRRNDSADATGRLYDKLAVEFDRARVFKDVDSIPLGQDFRSHLDTVIAPGTVVLVVIGPRWTDARDQSGRRRLDDPEDFVRIEIEAALSRNVPVIPVLVAHASMPVASELPASLAALAYRQAIAVRPDPDFHGDASRLTAALRAMLPFGPAAEVVRPPKRVPSRANQRRAWVIACGVAALLSVIGFLLPPKVEDEQRERVVVLDFVQDTGAPADFAHGLGERIRGALSTSQVRTLAQADASEFRGSGISESAARHDVSFLLDGSVKSEGAVLRVGMQLSDARANQALWSHEYRRNSDEALLLQEQVAAHAADVLRCALVSRRPNAGPIDLDTLAIFLRACDQVQRFDGQQQDMIASSWEVVRRAPDFSRGWSMLAMASAYASRSAAPGRRDQLRGDAEQAAARALSLDPNNEEALLARSVALPLLGAWRERGQLIDEAASLDPRSAQALLLRAELFSETGRIAEALDQNRQATAIDPLAPSYWAAQVPLLAALKRPTELAQLHERLYRTWPSSPSAVFNRFNSYVYQGEAAEALHMIDSGQVTENPLLRRYLEAKVGGNQSDQHQAVAAIAAAARAGDYNLPTAIALVSSSGDPQTAFELADLHFSGAGGEVSVDQPSAGAGRYFLFLISTENMRRHARFLALADRLGLLGYWRESGKWPDFCTDPALAQPCPKS